MQGANVKMTQQIFYYIPAYAQNKYCKIIWNYSDMFRC